MKDIYCESSAFTVIFKQILFHTQATRQSGSSNGWLAYAFGA